MHFIFLTQNNIGEDWNKRMLALKRLRYIVENGAIEIDNFGMYLGKLIPGLNCQVTF